MVTAGFPSCIKRQAQATGHDAGTAKLSSISPPPYCTGLPHTRCWYMPAQLSISCWAERVANIFFMPDAATAHFNTDVHNCPQSFLHAVLADNTSEATTVRLKQWSYPHVS
jgi:hypothetical protein